MSGTLEPTETPGGGLTMVLSLPTAQGNLRLYIAQLRRKLEPDPARPRYFRNEPGLGYRFEPEA